MNVLVVAVLGAFVGVGALLVAAGAQGRVVLDFSALRAGRLGPYIDRFILRLALATGAALAAVWATHWTVMVLCLLYTSDAADE